MIPNKAFQALACGTPLVTADTPAARELLVDGESALLVPAGDPEALAAAVRRLARAMPRWRGGSATAGSPPTGRRRARRCSASGGAASSSSSSRDDALAVRLARDRRLRGRLRRARRAAAPRLRQRPLRSRKHDPGGLVDRERRLALGHRRPRRADLAARLALRPDPRAARAAVVALAEPGAAARRAGRRRRRRGDSRSSGSRGRTSTPSARRPRSRSRTSSTRPCSG